jgi:hypothetical protein
LLDKYYLKILLLGIDKNKKHVLEYEFKNNSRDLKYAEKKKSKYQQQYKYHKLFNLKCLIAGF